MAWLLSGDVPGRGDGAGVTVSSLVTDGCTHPVPHLWRRAAMMWGLDGGRAVALDDPIAAARFRAEEVEAWRDAGIY